MSHSDESSSSSPSSPESSDSSASRPSGAPESSSPRPRPSGAKYVAVGILSSKVFGLVREMTYTRFLGVGAHADVLKLAFRAPNILQNMLGEQTLSAAFIPIYSRMLEEGRREEAGRFAGAIFGLLLALVFCLVTLGILAAPWIVAILSPGFLGDAEAVAAGEITVDRYALLVTMVRFIFPMTGFLVLAAWSMGVLNSHRRFFLPYMAPIFWNLAILSGLFIAAMRTGKLWTPQSITESDAGVLLYGVCLGATAGGLLQFLVQLPWVLKETRGLKFSISTKVAGVRDALKAFGPALAGRGVVQLSFYVDMVLASFLAAGAPAAINYATTLMNLPLSVFGMSVAAAELPELSRKDPEKARAAIADRIRSAMKQSSFLVAPAVVGYGVFGYLVVRLLYGGGRFGVASVWLVWAVLGFYTLGLLASTLSRLLQNSFFALRDTKTPAKIAVVRLVASAILGLILMRWFDARSVTSVMAWASELTGLDFMPSEDPKPLFMGACGLAAAASVGAWTELLLLVANLRRRLPELKFPVLRLAAFLAGATAVAVVCLALWYVLRGQGAVIQALVVLPTYAVLYLASAWLLKAPELDMWLGRFLRRRSRAD